jgi:hypothetical protein
MVVFTVISKIQDLVAAKAKSPLDSSDQRAGILLYRRYVVLLRR